ncbi:MAG: class IV adenylate cyclase [Acidobacteriaceae bacterium]
MQAAEIELKFSVDDVEKLRLSAQRLGFRLVTDRTFESNTLYDSVDRRLRSRRQILRIRHYGKICTVTHKRVADGDGGDVQYKTRIETESIVEDGDALAEIFLHLGYGPVFRYEKFRTQWEWEGGHLVLDETPIGVWAELEGSPEWIERVLEDLHVGPERRSTKSYGAMFLSWKEETGSSAENLAFDEIEAWAEARDLSAAGR